MKGASQLSLMVKNPPANAGDIRDVRSSPGLGRSPGGGHGNPLQYCCLENPMDRPSDPMDCSPPGSSVHGILQAKILEWVAMPSSRGSSQPRAITIY